MTVSKTSQAVAVTRAGFACLRFRSPGVTFFELDHPDTASDEQARLAEDRLAASESVDPPSAVPSAAWAPCCCKCDSDVPTLSASGGSVLAAADLVADNVAGVLARAGYDLDVLTILPASGQVNLLARAGWLVTQAVDAADLGTCAIPGRSLLVAARSQGVPGASTPRASTAG